MGKVSIPQILYGDILKYTALYSYWKTLGIKVCGGKTNDVKIIHSKIWI